PFSAVAPLPKKFRQPLIFVSSAFWAPVFAGPFFSSPVSREPTYLITPPGLCQVFFSIFLNLFLHLLPRWHNLFILTQQFSLVKYFFKLFSFLLTAFVELCYTVRDIKFQENNYARHIIC
ncbi:MAG: hypothetical protein IJE62_04025, partial [Clostridia bacterium]|nr:hypothetical protein [Clostridia bacterium]